VRRRLAPYVLIFPGGLWLAVFFVIPILVMVSLSTQTGTLEQGFKQTLHWQNYSDSIRTYAPQLLRSIEFGSIATIASLIVSYPMVYWIAFYGGRHKTTFLLLLLLPFFVSFVIRTLSWQFLLADQGILFGPLKSLHVLPQNFHVLATSFAVVCGLTYNFFPFMALPLYVALERIDRRYVEAAQDLYANKVQAFFKIIFPLSVPGIFAGVLLTFIPAASDFVNATILGGTHQTMIGGIIQTQFIQNFNYPVASALGFVVMAALLVGVLIYARGLGSEQLKEYVG
jgi:spermidine/putrescine transport system permease protein